MKKFFFLMIGIRSLRLQLFERRDAGFYLVRETMSEGAAVPSAWTADFAWPAPIRALFESEKELSVPVFAAVPRSWLFLGWRNSLESPALDEVARDCFPAPLHKLDWTGWTFSVRDQTVHHVLGILKERAEAVRQAVQSVGCPLFGITSYCYIHALSGRPSGEDRPSDWIFVYRLFEETELVLAHGATPLFARTLQSEESAHLPEISASTVGYVQKSYVDFSAERISERLDLQTEEIAAAFEKEKRFIPLHAGVSNSKLRAFLIRKREPLAGTLAAGFIAVSMGLNWANQQMETKLEKLNRSMKAVAREAGAPREWNADAFDSIDTLLPDFFNSVPEKAHLIEAHFESTQKSVTLRGRASGYDQVSRWGSLLSQDQRFKNVEIQKSAMVRLGQKSVVEFSLRANLK